MITTLLSLGTLALRWIGIGGFIAVALVFFYEFPGLGRVASEKREARLETDRAWQKRVREAEQALERLRVQRAREIADTEREELAAQEAADERERIRRAELDKALESASQPQTKEKINANEAPSAAPCVCTRQRIPSGVLRNIK